MKFTKMLCATVLVFVTCNAQEFTSDKTLVVPPLHDSFLNGAYKGVETVNPADPLEWLPFVLWWKIPVLAAVLHGADTVKDLVIPCLSNDKSCAEKKQKSYLAGYTLGNALKILMYAAPTLLIQIVHVGFYAASPYDYFSIDGAVPLQKISSTVLWSLAAMMVPTLAYFTQSMKSSEGNQKK
jgi:hypothetical protein